MKSVMCADRCSLVLNKCAAKYSPAVLGASVTASEDGGGAPDVPRLRSEVPVLAAVKDQGAN